MLAPTNSQSSRRCCALSIIADSIIIADVLESRHLFQLSPYLFVDYPACLSYADNISRRRVPSSLCILLDWRRTKNFVRVYSFIRIDFFVIVDFNDIDREYLWVWIIVWDEMILEAIND